MDTPLSILLHQRIRRSGPITFRTFMESALYDPDHGYYTSGKAKIGRAGDFFTNVSVGPLFGRMLARQFTEMWEHLERPANFAIVEQGAHSGTFASDVLHALQVSAPECFEASRYEIIEPSAPLRTAQAEALRPFDGKVFWHPSLQDLAPFAGVHFSNELLDAFPVHLVVWTGEEWWERWVTVENDRFTFCPGALSCDTLATQLARIPQPLPPGYNTEMNLAALDWAHTLASKILRGYVLAIDYGYPRGDYYAPERNEGTLSAYAQHRRVTDPLETPGEIDLTAHVDFTGVADEFERASAQLVGFTDQHHLMVGLSRLYFQDATTLGPEQEKELRAFKTLMHPGLMGMSFKALCVSKGLPSPTSLAGFHFARESRAQLGLPPL